MARMEKYGGGLKRAVGKSSRSTSAPPMNTDRYVPLDAIQGFQQAQGLKQTGLYDHPTRKAFRLKGLVLKPAGWRPKNWPKQPLPDRVGNTNPVPGNPSGRHYRAT